MHVIRPADATETAEAWRQAVLRRDGPTVLVLTRQGLPVLDRTKLAPAQGLANGAYVLSDCQGKPDVILIGTGSEVSLVLDAAVVLTDKGMGVRVVSMPCWELFDSQPKTYRDAVLPPDVSARLAVEAGCSMGWHKYVGDGGDVISIERFGASAPIDVVMDKFGFSSDNVVARAQALIGRG
jgi:transketolase